MIWFGSSAGVALSNLYPQAKSAGAWLLNGWHVALAYVIGFAALMLTLGWQPHAPVIPAGGAGHGSTEHPASLISTPLAAALNDQTRAGQESHP